MEDQNKKPADQTSDEQNKQGKTDGEKTFQQADVDAIVSKRLAEEQNKMRKEMQDVLAKERKEAERMAKLSAEEKEKEMLSKQQKENVEYATKLAVRENTLDVKEYLDENGVDKEFAEWFVIPDKEMSMDRAKSFIDKFNKAIQAGVDKKMEGGSAPKAIGNNSINTSKPEVTRVL